MHFIAASPVVNVASLPHGTDGLTGTSYFAAHLRTLFFIV
jgi:hypothetical protein